MEDTQEMMNTGAKKPKKPKKPAKAKKHWPLHRFLKFLELLQLYPELWEVTHDKYKDSQLKQTLWKKLLDLWPTEDKMLDPKITIEELKSHLKSIRKVMREKNKQGKQRRRSFGTGSGADVLEEALEEEFWEEDVDEEELVKINLPKWWDAAKFLKAHVSVRAKYETCNTQPQVESDGVVEPEIAMLPSPPESATTAPTSSVPKPSRATASHRPHHHAAMTAMDTLKETKVLFSEAVQAVRQSKRTCDEDDPFTDYVKRRMLKFVGEERQRIEDRILDVIRNFEREVAQQRASTHPEESVHQGGSSQRNNSLQRRTGQPTKLLSPAQHQPVVKASSTAGLIKDGFDLDAFIAEESPSYDSEDSDEEILRMHAGKP